MSRHVRHPLSLPALSGLLVIALAAYAVVFAAVLAGA